MNRFKFRVWCKDYNEWEKDPVFLSQDGLPYQLLKQERLLCIRPENHIVQFFTGFYDKNGREIYEGDIFKSGHYQWDSVEFEDGSFQVNLMGARIFLLNELFEEEYNRPEVIGNIFENPELLK